MKYLLLSWHRGLSQNEVIILPEPFEAQGGVEKFRGDTLFTQRRYAKE